MTRRRIAGIAFALVGVLIAALLAVWLIGASAIDLRMARDAEGGADRTELTIEADLPAATCRKVLTLRFPWVRFDCEPRGAGVDAP